MKSCHICGSPCDSEGYCSQPKNHKVKKANAFFCYICRR